MILDQLSLVYISYIYYVSKDLICNKVLNTVCVLTNVPVATKDGRSQLVLYNNTMTVIAFTNMEGNSVPNVTWTGQSNILIP